MIKRDWIFVTGQPGAGKTTTVQKLIRHIQSHNSLESSSSCFYFLTGFYTQEVRNNDCTPPTRIGFDVVTVSSCNERDGHRCILARIPGYLPSNRSYPRTGKYSVDVESFERLAIPSLMPYDQQQNNDNGNNNNNGSNKNNNNNTSLSALATSTTINTTNTTTIFILDEIGRMELHSKQFQETVQMLLTVPNSKLIGAITAPRYGHRVPFCDFVSSQSGVQVYNLTKKTRDTVTQQLQQDITNRWFSAEQV